MAGNSTRWRFRPDCLVTWPVFIGSLLWSFITHFSDMATNDYSGVALRMLLLVVVQGGMFLLLGAVWLAVRRQPERRAVAVLMVSVLVGTFLRGCAFGWLLYAVGLTPTSTVLYRAAASLVHQTLVVGLLWLGTSEVVRHNERLRALWLDRDRLLELQQETAASLRELDEKAAEDVRSAILASLGRGESAETEVVLQRLRVTVDDVVRPLSRQLESSGLRWRPPDVTERDFRLDWRGALRGALDPGQIRPLVLVGLVAWISLPINLYAHGTSFTAMFLAALVLVAVPLYWLARSLGARLCRGWGQVARAATFLVSLYLVGQVFGLVTLLFTGSIGKPQQFLLLGPLFSLLVGTLVALADSAHAQALDVERDLEAVTAELRWRIARAREEDRQHRNALAHAVHGRIQATLAAAILQLDGAVKQGTATGVLVEDVQQRVVDCVVGLDLRATTPDPLPELFREVRRSWAGVIEVALEVDSEVERCLEADVQCLTTLNDLVPELVFNAMKHGQCREVLLSLRCLDARSLELLAVDDGSGLGEGEGVGSRLLDDCSMEWDRMRAGDRTVTRVVLPLLPLPD